jgi:beta-N-acetylhexosaminidase
MLVVGFRGTEIADTNHIVRDIRDYHIGGVILFEYDVPSQSRPRNITSPKQLKALCTALQGLSEEKLLIGIDQEGGRVNRLKQTMGFPPFKSAQQSSKEGDASVRYQAKLTAKTLADAGINLDFAPCVDVNVNPNCPIIGKLERSFGGDPSRVTTCAKIWISELQQRGVIACPKHFPGHGSSKDDTHLGMADVSDTWTDAELEPYRQLIAQGQMRMLMTTHVFNSQLDSIYPATLSKATLTGLLRDSLGYTGVIITDDMAMGAMQREYSYEEMLLRSILAGADMLCLSNNGQYYNPDIVPQTVDIIYQMVKRGKITRARIHESAERIKKLK